MSPPAQERSPHFLPHSLLFSPTIQYQICNYSVYFHESYPADRQTENNPNNLILQKFFPNFYWVDKRRERKKLDIIIVLLECYFKVTVLWSCWEYLLQGCYSNSSPHCSLVLSLVYYSAHSNTRLLQGFFFKSSHFQLNGINSGNLYWLFFTVNRIV